MGYLFLGLATVAGLTKGFCGKRVSGYVKESRDAMISNLIRMAFCILIGLVLVIVMLGPAGFAIGGMGLLISAVSGAANAIFMVTWLFAVNRGAYMLVDVFLTLGLVVPVSLSAVFFGEGITWNHYVGLAVLLVAVLVMCSYSSAVKARLDLPSLLLLLVCGLSQGICSFAQKWFVRAVSAEAVSAFNLYTYLCSAVVLAVAYLVIRRQNAAGGAPVRPFPARRLVGYIAVMAAMLFLSSYLMTLAAAALDAVVLYPLSTGLNLALSAVMSAVAFRERLTGRCLIGIALTFAALLIINVL